MKKLILFIAAFGFYSISYAQTNGKETPKKESRYTYYENDGIFMYYETEEKETYRNLLPAKFEMPDRLLVYTFVSDFYKMDKKTQPYKEASIFLLGKYEDKEIWHCIFMPVTSRESMWAGILRLGLPKTMGEISFTRNEPNFNATTKEEAGHKMELSINTESYKTSKNEEELLKELSNIPKYNIRKGEIIEMTRSGSFNVFDIAEKFPNRMIVKRGKGEIDFDIQSDSENSSEHPFHLTPSKILGTYYLLNKIPFRLGSNASN